MAVSNHSLAALVKELREGETVSRSVRIPLTDLTDESVAKKLASMRNSMNQTAGRVRESTERGFRVESGSFITSDNTAVMLVVTITCMEDEGEDDI